MEIKKAQRKRKYLIFNELNKLPYEEHLIAKSKLPVVLGVSKRTFERWTYLYIDERLEIPADKLAILANYFDCPIEKLFNYTIPQYNTAQLKSLETNQLAEELNLTR